MSNPFALFTNLLPKQVKIVGKIVAKYSDGTAKLLKIDGVTNILVKGVTDSYSNNDYVLVVDNVIFSKLSNVQQTIEIEIQ